MMYKLISKSFFWIMLGAIACFVVLIFMLIYSIIPSLKIYYQGYETKANVVGFNEDVVTDDDGDEYTVYSPIFSYIEDNESKEGYGIYYYGSNSMLNKEILIRAKDSFVVIKESFVWDLLEENFIAIIPIIYIFFISFSIKKLYIKYRQEVLIDNIDDKTVMPIVVDAMIKDVIVKRRNNEYSYSYYYVLILEIINNGKLNKLSFNINSDDLEEGIVNKIAEYSDENEGFYKTLLEDKYKIGSKIDVYIDPDRDEICSIRDPLEHMKSYLMKAGLSSRGGNYVDVNLWSGFIKRIIIICSIIAVLTIIGVFLFYEFYN